MYSRWISQSKAPTPKRFPPRTPDLPPLGRATKRTALGPQPLGHCHPPDRAQISHLFRVASTCCSSEADSLGSALAKGIVICTTGRSSQPRRLSSLRTAFSSMPNRQPISRFDTPFVHQRQLEMCKPAAAVAAGLWETRSVFQGVWEGAVCGSLPCPGRPAAGGSWGSGGRGGVGFPQVQDFLRKLLLFLTATWAR